MFLRLPKSRVVARYLRIAIAIHAIQASGASTSYELTGKVVRVKDGDTVVVLDSNKLEHDVRIGGIDAPESNQPFGRPSQQSLARAVNGRDVRLEWSKKDSHGRFLAKVWTAPPNSLCPHSPCAKTIDVGLAQLSVGLAWHFKQFAPEQSAIDRRTYESEENAAREHKLGLWTDPEPVPPWEWRHGLAGGPIKKSKSSICHAPESPSYKAVKKFTTFKSLEECMKSGGRLPK